MQAAKQAPNERSSRQAGSRSARPSRRARRLLLFGAFILLVALLCSRPDRDVSDLLHDVHEPKTALIFTAHPDDEVMFFTPTILALLAGGWEVRALCLSTGNGDGLGEIRSKELVRSYQALGVPEDHVSLLDEPYLQDGMQNHWSSSYVSHVLDEHLSSHQASVIITFDLVGITHHPNHIALAHGCSFAPSASARRCFALRSPTLLFKFTGPLWAILHDFTTRLPSYTSSEVARAGGRQITTNRHLTVTNDLAGWWTGAVAMSEHKSQLVWFRYLYFAFSRLVWHNKLEELPEHG